MRPDLVVVLLPGGEHGARLTHRAEQRLVQAFVAQLAVEAFDEGVLLRLAGRDIVPADASIRKRQREATLNFLLRWGPFGPV
jgi:hypothetical protein